VAGRPHGQFFRTSGSARPAERHATPLVIDAQSVAHALDVGSFSV
jgi:hypothetical protein